MRIATANRKGGTGKTSIAGNLAFELSQQDRTILIDCDPQGSLSSWLADGKSPRHELAEVLDGTCELPDAITEIYPGLDLIATFIDGELRTYAETKAMRAPFVFVDLCGALEELGYRYIMADMPPAFGTFEETALSAMDRALMVLEPEFLAFDGLAGILDDLEDTNRRRRSLVRYDWLVANRVNAGFRRHRAYIEAYGEAWQDFRLYQIPQSSKVGEAQSYHEPLALYEPNEDRALPRYRELADAIRGER